MLNEKGERELAYVVKVDDIKPIPGRDRVECAMVGGWTVMVRKGQFKPGDTGIYFEIDSRVPEREPFEFLAPKHYRIKTQKYKTPDGQFWSQGLLMSAEDFGWVKFNDARRLEQGEWVSYTWSGIFNEKDNEIYFLDNDSRFLTEKLGVTYAEAEDNKRKAAPVDKYKRMALRNGKLFAKQPFRWLMRREWGKRLLFIFFGKKKDKKYGWPEWVRKTDEERCLAGKTKIDTDKGKILLSTIVNKKLPVRIKTVNLSNGKIEYKPIISYQKYKTKEDLLDIEFVQENDGDTKKNRVICTKDHRFYVNGEYIPAKYLSVSDRATRCYKTLPREILDVLYGIMLGDGCLTFDKRHKIGRAKFSYTQHKNHFQYFELIRKSFGSPNTYPMKSGYTGKDDILRFFFSDQLCRGVLEEMGVINNGRFFVNDIFCNALTVKSIAVWYMDDGTLRHRDKVGQRPTAEIASNSFSREENELLIRALDEIFGIDCSLKYDASRGFYSIYITADGTDKLSRMIAPFVPECMRYKLTKDADVNYPFDKELWRTSECSENLFTAEVTSIKPFVNHTNGYHVYGSVYDIEVADNHNFFANGILTHNCQNIPWILNQDTRWISTEKIDGSSTTFTIHRGKHKWSEPEFYVCSRNVCFKTGKESLYYDTNIYTEMAEKYNVREVLERMLRSRPNEEWITIQGETFGPGVQKRDYGLEGRQFAAFNLIFSSCGRVNSVEMANTLSAYNIPTVPILAVNIELPKDVDEVLKLSDGKSYYDGGMREGIVYRSADGQQSFKTVSNEYLLKYH